MPRTPQGDFGYNADTPAGDRVLDGSYQILGLPHEAINDIHQQLPPNSIPHMINRDTWQWAWKHKQESTSSSQSGLHFGHYVSGANSDLISDMHALKYSIALHHGIALSRWKSGLCVMLGKSPSVRLISKLRAILLMKADFNAANKNIFGQRMLQNV